MMLGGWGGNVYVYGNYFGSYEVGMDQGTSFSIIGGNAQVLLSSSPQSLPPTFLKLCSDPLARW